MAKHPRPARGEPADLEPYEGCRADTEIGLTPLAVGWLQPGRPFDVGETPPDFLPALLPFCLPPETVCPWAQPPTCPLCRQRIALPGEQRGATSLTEIRVIGETEIYAAPALIYHYVQAHHYRPPDEFVAAVLQGPPPGSAEHRALIRALQTLA